MKSENDKLINAWANELYTAAILNLLSGLGQSLWRHDGTSALVVGFFVAVGLALWVKSFTEATS